MLGFTALSELPLSTLYNFVWVSVPDSGVVIGTAVRQRNVSFADLPLPAPAAAAVATPQGYEAIFPMRVKRVRPVDFSDQDGASAFLPATPVVVTVTPAWVSAPERVRRRAALFGDDRASLVHSAPPQPPGARLVVADFVTRRRSMIDFFDDDEAAPLVVQVPRGAGLVSSPDPIRRRRSQQVVSPFPSIVVPAAFRGSAWVTVPEKVRKALQPQPAAAQGLLPARGYAWVVQIDVPGVRRAPRSADAALVVPTAFRGSAWVAVDFNVNKKPRRIAGADASPLPVQPVPTKFIPNAWSVTWDGPARKRYRAELQRADQPVLATYLATVITYPDGWQTSAPERMRQRGNSGGGGNIPINVPAVAFTQGWVVAADVIRTPRRVRAVEQPAALPPSKFYGWVAAADVRLPPPRAAAPDGSARGQFIAASPQGWSVAAEARPVPRRKPSAGVEALAVQQVPTKFIGNAWVMAWDGPPRKPFGPALQRSDLPVLAAYSSVIITYPDGWQVTVPERPRRRGVRSDNIPTAVVPVVASHGWVVRADVMPPKRRAPPDDRPMVPPPLRFYGWVVAADVRQMPKRVKAADGAAFGQFIAAAPSGWSVTSDVSAARRLKSSKADGAAFGQFIASAPVGWSTPTEAPRRRKPSQWPQEAVPLAPQTAVQSVADYVWGVGAPKLRKPPATDYSAPVQQFIYATGDAAIWGFVSYRFRTIIPAAPQMQGVTIKPVLRIGSQPTLIGTSTAPTLYGASTAPTLLAVSTGALLVGVSTAPGLLGTSTNPGLLGEV